MNRWRRPVIPANFGVRSRQARVALVIGAMVAYALAFLPLYDLMGLPVSILAGLPVILAGWLLGLRAGLLATLCILVELTILHNIVGHSGCDAAIRDGGGMGIVLTAIISIVVGRLHDLSEQLKQEIAERQRAERALGVEEQLLAFQQDLERHNTRLEILYRVGQLVNSTLDTATILDYLTDEAMRVTNASHGQVLVVREETGGFERHSQRGFSPEELKRALTIPLPLDQGINGRAYTTRQIICVNDVQAEPGYFSLISTTRTELAVPIIRDERVLGNLDLQSPEVGAFRDVDLDYLTALTDQVAIALENARLYTATRRQAEHLEALHQVSHDLAVLRDLDTQLHQIVQRAMQLVNAEAGGIYLYRHQEELLEWVVGVGEGLAPVGTTLARGEGLSGKVWEARQPMNVSDYSNWCGKTSKWATTTGCILGLPIQWGDEFLGVLNIRASLNHNHFTEEDIRLMSQFAGQAAVALQNARLHEQAQQEIAERMQVEEALRKSNALLESLIESLPQHIFSKDLSGRFTFANQRYCTNAGKSLEEIIGKTDFDLHPTELAEKYRKDDRQVIETGQVLDKVEEHQIIGAEKFYVQVIKAPIVDSLGHTTGVLGIFWDITERRRAEVQLQRYAAELRRSNRELQNFTYVASHDLQEPLRKVQAFGDRLVTKYSKALDDQGRNYLARMQRAAKRMQMLIDALLTYSEVTTRAQTLIPVDLNNLAREAIAESEIYFERMRGQVKITSDLPTIHADPFQMRQLISNLIDNALKFHREDEPPIVKIYAEELQEPAPYQDDKAPDAEFCRIFVEDNGIGFDEKYLDRIFQVFQRLHGRNVYEGAGVGLTICRRIVERHGGDITAKSAPGQGATFIITLPTRQT